jgi:hypothetical protein
MDHQVYQLSDAGIKFVSKCIGILEERGLDEEGIYRLSGSSARVEELLALCLDNPDTKIENVENEELLTNKSLTGAIKQYLRYIEEPLMTRKYFYYFVKAASE